MKTIFSSGRLTVRPLKLTSVLVFSTTISLAQKSDDLQGDSAYLRLETVTVSADRIIDRSSVSDLALKPGSIQAKQGLFEDPLRAITFFPGISKGNGDLFSPSQIYVRGGSPEENLYMFDNVRVYFPWYFGGIKSIFNTETIDHLELLTGGFPAKYGNAMSSILNVTTRNGNFTDFHGNFSVGFANSQFTFEGPLVKNKISFLVSARKTYLDFFIKDPRLFPVNNFGDITYKLSWRLNEKHRFFLSGISGYNGTEFLADKPAAGVANSIHSKGQLHNQSLQWQALLSSSVYSKLSLIHSQTASDVTVGRNLDLLLTGEIYGVREDLTCILNRNYKINIGGELNNSGFSSVGNIPFDPFELDPNDTSVVLRSFNFSSARNFSGAYASIMGSAEKFHFNAGGRYDRDGESNNFNFSPRLSMSYDLTTKTVLRGAWGYFYQFPGEEAVKSNPAITSSKCTHYIFGFGQEIRENYNGWIEAYYKDYEDLVVYDSSLKYTNFGRGYSKGIEVFATKKRGRLTGTLSYGYSISKRRESLQVKEYFFAYDQRHILNNTLEVNINNKEKFYIPHLLALTFTFRTGTPYTPVATAIKTAEGWRPVKKEPFSGRNPAYHNLNLRIEFKTWVNRRKKIQIYSYIEIWNLYNRKNLMGRIYQYGTEFNNNVNEQIYYSTPFLQAGGVKLQFN